MQSSYCFSRHNFLVELIAGLGGAFLVGVPGVIVGSFFGSVYGRQLVWNGLVGEQAGGMAGLLIGLTIGGWLLVYLMGQMIHDHRSGIVSFCSALATFVLVVFFYDSAMHPLTAFVVLLFPVFAAALAYNLPVIRTSVVMPAAALAPVRAVPLITALPKKTVPKKRVRIATSTRKKKSTV